MQSSFGKEYCEYWKRRETSEATTKAHKRRLDTFLQLNEDTCEGIEAISKNVPFFVFVLRKITVLIIYIDGGASQKGQ